MEKDEEEELLAQLEVSEKFLSAVQALGDYCTWLKKLASLMVLWYFVIHGVIKWYCCNSQTVIEK